MTEWADGRESLTYAADLSEMTPLLIPDDLAEPIALCLGAHCDDIEIGCGATLSTLAARHPRLRFHWVVFTSDDRRAAETRAAAARLLDPARVSVEVHGLRTSWLPGQWGEAKDLLEAVAARMSPAIVFTHRLEDRHQDHRTVAELTWNTFRDHLVLEYEIAKYEGDLGQPNLFVPVSRDVARRKVRTLLECFPSQAGRDWFDEDAFLGLMRVRGLECRAPERLAEAFHARKLIL